MADLPVLNAVQQRILGSLMEKQVTVPASYPLSLNALRTACNQTSSREPVMDLDEQTLQHESRELRDAELVRIVWADSGRRTRKYHQTLTGRLDLTDAETALITVLLLRGPQAPGELRTRTERLHGFADRADVEGHLAAMAQRVPALVRELPRQHGQKDSRWVHLLGPVDVDDSGPVAAPLAPAIDVLAAGLRRATPRCATPMAPLRPPMPSRSAPSSTRCPSNAGCSIAWSSRQTATPFSMRAAARVTSRRI